MFKYYNLPIFNGHSRKTRINSLFLSVKRAKLYKKRTVQLKIFSMILVFSFLIIKYGSYVNGLVIGFSVFIPFLSTMLFRNEIEKYVLPLVPNAIADSEKFPDVNK